MKSLEILKNETDELAKHASEKLENQNLADIIKDASNKIAQAMAHPDAKVFDESGDEPEKPKDGTLPPSEPYWPATVDTNSGSKSASTPQTGPATGL